jgi:uncharacterized membrane protein YjjP (DUF1212 family)
MGRIKSSFGRSFLKFGSWSMVVSGICSLGAAMFLGLGVASAGEPDLFIVVGGMAVIGAIFLAAGIKNLRQMKTTAGDAL